MVTHPYKMQCKEMRALLFLISPPPSLVVAPQKFSSTLPHEFSATTFARFLPKEISHVAGARKGLKIENFLSSKLKPAKRKSWLSMEKTEKETHDFMNVESFSQLPFIRPAPAREKHIRLFGIEFGSDVGAGGTPDSPEEAEAVAGRENGKEGPPPGAVGAGGENEETCRKFECHYCCRNFPTSQALGGHQNAHKRERQHAKRAHLQSTAAHDPAGPPVFLNYHHPPSAAYKIAVAAATGGGGGFDSPPHYPWARTAAVRSFSSYSQPINGSPLPGLWRIPTVHQSQTLGAHDRSFSSSVVPLPLFAGEEGVAPGARRVYDSNAAAAAAVHDHVSLDLHL